MGITGCCNKSENENTPSTPASFLLIHNFRPGLIRRRGYRLSMLPRGWPSASPAGPSARVLLPAHQQHAAISAKSRARNFRIENAARRSGRQHWNRWQLRGGLAINAIIAAQHAEAVRVLGKRAVRDIIEIGRRLTEAKSWPAMVASCRGSIGSLDGRNGRRRTS